MRRRRMVMASRNKIKNDGHSKVREKSSEIIHSKHYNLVLVLSWNIFALGAACVMSKKHYDSNNMHGNWNCEW